MPEHIRALIVILGLAAIIFFYIRKTGAQISGSKIFDYRRNLWIGVTLIAFLSHNFWLYSALTWLAIVITSRTDTAKVSIFLFLLFTVPGVTGHYIPAFGLVNYLFELTHQRLLVISLLLPAFLKIITTGGNRGSSNKLIDRLVIAFILLTVILSFRGTTLTNTLRFAFDQFLDIYVPYYVVSHAIRSINGFKDTMASYVVVVLILSLIGVFETARHWLLYIPLYRQLDIAAYLDVYLRRDGLLRASASLSRIPLGYVISIGIGFHLFLKDYFPSKRTWNICLLILVAGLIAPLSRGPWVGALVLILTVGFFSKSKARSLFKVIGVSSVLLVVISVTPIGSTLLGLIPFVGDVESSTLTYRQKLLENSWIVIQRNLVFGSIDYLKAPEMLEMMQGQGIIDVVNTYLSVALKYGIVGLSIFFGVFSITGWRVYRRFKRYSKIDNEIHYLGLVLFATLACIMVTIFTVSSVSAIPIMYWVTIGLCSAYIKMVDAIKPDSGNDPAAIRAQTPVPHPAKPKASKPTPRFRA